MATVNVNLDITTANVPESTDRNYVTDAQKTVIENTSGTNTGDQDLSGYLQKSGYIMDVNAQALFAGAIDIQSNGVTDYSKSWYYGDENFAQMGFGANHYLNATASLIELVALAPNSIYQVTADSASEYARMIANKNGALAEFIVNPGLPATYRNTANHPIKYFGDYFDGDVRSLVDWGTIVSALASFKTANFLDATSSIQTQLNSNSKRLAHNYTPASGTAVTSEEVLHTLEIEAGKVAAGDLLEWYAATANTNSANNKTWRMYINTTPNLSGSPVLLATSVMTANAQTTTFSRKIPVLSTTSVFCYGSPTQTGATPYASIQATSTNVAVPDLSAGFYIIITAQKANSGETVTVNFSDVFITK